jgi:hypothetical protein
MKAVAASAEMKMMFAKSTLPVRQPADEDAD